MPSKRFNDSFSIKLKSNSQFTMTRTTTKLTFHVKGDVNFLIHNTIFNPRKSDVAPKFAKFLKLFTKKEFIYKDSWTFWDNKYEISNINVEFWNAEVQVIKEKIKSAGPKPSNWFNFKLQIPMNFIQEIDVNAVNLLQSETG